MMKFEKKVITAERRTCVPENKSKDGTRTEMSYDCSAVSLWSHANVANVGQKTCLLKSSTFQTKIKKTLGYSF